MNAIVKQSVFNIRRHLEKNRKAFFGMYMGLIPGGFCQIYTTNERPYHIDYTIDELSHTFFVDVHPHIICEKPFRFMMNAYVNEKTSQYKRGRIDINSETGEVKIRVGTSILENPVSVNLIDEMEHLALFISDGIEKRLEKIAHGIYFRDDDPALMGASEKLRQALSEIKHEHDSERSFEDYINSIAEHIDKEDSTTCKDSLEEFMDDFDEKIEEFMDDFDEEIEDGGDKTEGDVIEDPEISFEALFPENELA